MSKAEVSQKARAHYLTELEHTDLVEEFEPQPPFSDVPLKCIISEGALSMPRSLESVTTSSNLSFPRLEENHVDKTEKQSSLKKTSSNVRKMISAFENSVTQVFLVLCLMNILHMLIPMLLVLPSVSEKYFLGNRKWSILLPHLLRDLNQPRVGRKLLSGVHKN